MMLGLGEYNSLRKLWEDAQGTYAFARIDLRMLRR